MTEFAAITVSCGTQFHVHRETVCTSLHASCAAPSFSVPVAWFLATGERRETGLLTCFPYSTLYVLLFYHVSPSSPFHLNSTAANITACPHRGLAPAPWSVWLPLSSPCPGPWNGLSSLLIQWTLWPPQPNSFQKPSRDLATATATPSLQGLSQVLTDRGRNLVAGVRHLPWPDSSWQMPLLGTALPCQLLGCAPRQSRRSSHPWGETKISCTNSRTEPDGKANVCP